MAVYKIFPEKDSTIYSEFPVKNTGIDEILEVSTFYNTTIPQVSRFLIQFSQDEINSLISDTGKINSSTFQSNLKLFLADVSGLNTSTTLEVYPISGSWNMGTGRYSNEPETTNGCSWRFKLSSGSKAWTIDNFSNKVTASYNTNSPGGGTWYTGSNLSLNVTQSQVLSYSSDKDININVTDTVLTWNSHSLNNVNGFPNDGFIIKQSEEDEFVEDLNFVTNVKYFSIDTHTIYPPQLEFKWDDFIYNTGSSTNTIINTSELVATLANNKEEFVSGSIHTSQLVVSLDGNAGVFRSGSIQKVRVNCRPQFPTRVFQTASLYTTNHYLPTASFYAIKDLDTNEFVIDFDETYTKISADDKSSYFVLYMNGLEPERYYQILIKTTVDGSTLILDDNLYFKVKNG